MPTGKLKCKPQSFTKGPRSPGRFVDFQTQLAFVNISIYSVSTTRLGISFWIFVFKVQSLQWEAAHSLSKQHVALSGILMAFRSLVVRIDLRFSQSAFQEDMGLCLAAFFLLFSILSFVVAVGYTAMCGVYTATLSAVCLASFDLPCLRSSGSFASLFL